MHDAQAVLQPGVVRAREDVVGASELLYASQPVKLERVEKGVANHGYLDFPVDRVDNEM